MMKIMSEDFDDDDDDDNDGDGEDEDDEGGLLTCQSEFDETCF